MLAITAGGHILIDDIPGVGKTTMAMGFAKAMGYRCNRIQFTPDVMPSDIVGFRHTILRPRNLSTGKVPQCVIFCLRMR